MPKVVQELLALGIARVGVVSEFPDRYRDLSHPQLRLFGLEEHAGALAEFRQVAGTSVLILDKECATEKIRRRRRQGVGPGVFIAIDERLCEGCGDCLRQSEGCAALHPVATDFGEKMQVRQGGCTQDQLCTDGECPAFVRVHAAGLRQRQPEELADLPEPTRPPAGTGYRVFAAGRGGTGVVTVSHLLAYAAMMEGTQVYLSNNTGLAQKGGPVEAPMVFSTAGTPAFNRFLPGSADLYLGFDLLRAAEPANLKYASSGRTRAVTSTAAVPTAQMNRHPEQRFPAAEGLRQLIDTYTCPEANLYLDTYALAEALFADTLYANMLLVGAAYQAGALPVGSTSIEQAIRLNGKAVGKNIQAFRWGRLSVADPARVQALLSQAGRAPAEAIAAQRETLAGEALALHDQTLAAVKLDEEGRRLLSLRLAELCAYQDVAYARRYAAVVRQVNQAEADHPRGELALTAAVGSTLYRLMAYKDEYEVARLITDPAAAARLERLFAGTPTWSNLLHPPNLRALFRRKLGFGGWSRPLLRLLYRCRGLRGTAFDIFGRTACRRLERALVDWYVWLVGEVLARLGSADYRLAVRILSLPERIRGFEQVKIHNAAQVQQEVADLLAQLGPRPAEAPA